ncbi:MAG TPA: cytochrome c3 family protein [Polyangiaceae bacterium]|nr:cytochrome c3 family protein [Polyangiaceae bacterium]
MAGSALVLALAPGFARTPARESPHRADADCTLCHRGEAAALARDPVAARGLLVPDLEARCMGCHSAEGPSHRTGVRPRGAVPASLPLSSDGLITCATCHFVHGEGERKLSYERIDNRRGQLCLTCHTMSELQ